MEGEPVPDVPEDRSPAAAKRGKKKVEKEEAPKWDESAVVSGVESLNWDQILIDEDLTHGQVPPDTVPWEGVLATPPPLFSNPPSCVVGLWSMAGVQWVASAMAGLCRPHPCGTPEAHGRQAMAHIVNCQETLQTLPLLPATGAAGERRLGARPEGGPEAERSC